METNFTCFLWRLMRLFLWLWLYYGLPLLSYAQVCSDPSNVIYGLTDQGNIRGIHVSNATVDSPFATPPYTGSGMPTSNAIGYNPVYGDFDYFAVENSSIEFVEFNPTMGTNRVLFPPPNYNYVVSACVDAAGSHYYCLNGPGKLMTYNLSTNYWTTLTTDFVNQFGQDVTAAFDSLGSGDMAMDGLGDLWIVTSSSTSFALYVISAANIPTDSVATIIVDQILPPTATFGGAAFNGIAFDPSGQIYLGNMTDLYLLHGDMSTITHVGTYDMASSEGMYDLTSCNFPLTTLAVDWTNFTATPESGGVVGLTWQYGQPVAKGTYSVQRSADGRNWVGLEVKEVSDAIGSATYSFTDDQPLTGKEYYRIQLQMPNGSESYSRIRLVELSPSLAIQISPNPVLNSLYIQNNAMGAGGMALVYDQTGRTLIESAISTGFNSISMSSLIPGIYIVEVIFSSGQRYTQKIVKQ